MLTHGDKLAVLPTSLSSRLSALRTVFVRSRQTLVRALRKYFCPLRTHAEHQDLHQCVFTAGFPCAEIEALPGFDTHPKLLPGRRLWT